MCNIRYSHVFPHEFMFLKLSFNKTPIRVSGSLCRRGRDAVNGTAVLTQTISFDYLLAFVSRSFVIPVTFTAALWLDVDNLTANAEF